MDSPRTIRSSTKLLTLGALLAGMLPLAAQEVTQTLNLQAGWNAVYVEVEPAVKEANVVFASHPISSVWTRAERVVAVDFIQDSSEEVFGKAGWLAWFHPSRPEAFVGNLFAVNANRAYLIKADAAFTLTLTGRPSARHPDWAPDKFNLRGFPVDPANAPTFRNFFVSSAAQFDATQNSLRGIYRLNAGGQWGLVANGDLMRSGEAYWVFSKGASDFTAPLRVELEIGDGLEYGLELDQLRLGLRNSSTSSGSVSLRTLPAASALSTRQFNPAVGYLWSALPSPHVVSVAGGQREELRLAVRRSAITSTIYTATLEITDGLGTRHRIPVSAEKLATTGAASAQSGSPETGAISEARSHAGLWLGNVTVNAVSEAHSSNPTNATPTKSQFDLRLLVHVDGNGQARLLKQVTQMWKNGTYTNAPDGLRTQATPGRYVLLTDDRLIPSFQGAGVRDGVPVGRRISTIGFDFPTRQTNNYLNLTGFFATGQRLNGTLAQGHDDATNPFKHKYHPDHDNLNVRFDGPAVEAYATTRQIQLEFTATPPDGTSAPDYGHDVMGGIYREVISGLHKTNLYVRGTFRLNRQSIIPDLNPSPTP